MQETSLTNLAINWARLFALSLVPHLGWTYFYSPLPRESNQVSRSPDMIYTAWFQNSHLEVLNFLCERNYVNSEHWLFWWVAWAGRWWRTQPEKFLKRLWLRKNSCVFQRESIWLPCRVFLVLKATQKVWCISSSPWRTFGIEQWAGGEMK